MSRKFEIAILTLIVLFYIGTAYAYASRTPDWQVPDEPAHYNYVRQIVENGNLPTIEIGDWNQEYQTLLVSSGFDPSLLDDLDQIQYEDHQPPLYYVLQANIYRLTDGDLLPLRIFSALLGGGVVICAWAIVRRLFPNQPLLGLTTAAFIAFLPQRLSIMSGVSNDSLAELIAGLVLLAITLYLTNQTISDRWELQAFQMGVLVGLAFLTKTTIYYTAAIAGLAIILRWWRERWTWRIGVPQLMLYLIPALSLGAIWWIHSIDIYGGTDFVGLQRHDEVVVGQPRTDDYIRDVYAGSQRIYWEQLGQTTFHSFWGQFGWMAFPMKTNIYRILLVLVLLALIGMVIYAIQHQWPYGLKPPQYELLSLFALSITLVVAQFLIYNQTFVQFQGRYLYPALIPLALIIAFGTCGWANLLSSRVPLAKWIPFVVITGMGIFAWYALLRVISVIPG